MIARGFIRHYVLLSLYLSGISRAPGTSSPATSAFLTAVESTSVLASVAGTTTVKRAGIAARSISGSSAGGHFTSASSEVGPSRRRSPRSGCGSSPKSQPLAHGLRVQRGMANRHVRRMSSQDHSPAQLRPETGSREQPDWQHERASRSLWLGRFVPS